MGDLKMPAWPDPKDYTFSNVWHDHAGHEQVDEPYLDQALYQRARYEAAMARLRAAVECMTDVQRILVDKDIAHREAVGMYNTLVAIGPLPPEPPP